VTWLVPFAPVGARPVRVCLPQAGSGCGVFRSWQDVLDDVTVVGVQLPGREARFMDPPPDSFAAAVAEIVAELVSTVPSGQSIVLFGHSLGGLLAYEVTRALPGTHTPAALVVAASKPPHLSGRVAGSMGADDGLEVLAGMVAAKDMDPDVRELVMEILEQDVELSASYEDPGGAPVPCPLHAWGGEDDEIVTEEHLGGWSAYASGAFEARRFPGGHEFCVESPAAAHAARELLSPSRQGV
jgi:surfactin synthase thioesterase subunit